tara:strand:- start:32 stop:193 length:162 start_codon:yes stop_codon:yes gene_type:complete
MFSAPAAPEPMATAISEIIEVVSGTCIGAINSPTMQVKRTKDITLGFIKLKKD